MQGVGHVVGEGEGQGVGGVCGGGGVKIALEESGVNEEHGG